MINVIKFKTLHLALHKTIFNKKTKSERLKKIYQFDSKNNICFDHF